MYTLKHICKVDSDWFSHPDAPRICACRVDSYHHGLKGSLFSMYWTKFDPKMTKMKQNYMVIMILNVPGTLCQLILYFPGKQGLAINLTWPSLKSKQRTCILPPSADQCGFSFFLLAFQFMAITKYIINKIMYSLGIRKLCGVN